MSRFAFTLLSVWLMASVAYADRVAFYPASGPADDARREQVSAAIAAALSGLGHEVISNGNLRRPGNGGEPATRPDMIAAAVANQAAWTLIAQVTTMPGQYRLHLAAAHRPTGRMEEIDVNVIEVQEEQRLHDVLGALIRLEGLGGDLLRLTNDELAVQRAAQDRAAAEERARQEAAVRAEQLAQREAADRARQEAAAREEAERQARLERERREAEEAARFRYGASEDPPWIVQAGLGFMGLLASPGTGGALGDLRTRLGYAIPQVRGLEPRVGVDVSFGSASSVNFVLGATYLVSPFLVPVFVGGGAETGVFIGTSGSREPYFLMRLSGNLSWRPMPRVYIEASMPEITYLSAGALGLGMHVRAGYRF